MYGKEIITGLSKIFGVPTDIVADLPGLSMVGNNDLLIRNYDGLAEFGDARMIIRKSGGQILVSGKKLKIIYISREEILINGCISSVSFECGKV